MQHSCVELEHEHGVESDPDLVFSSGNDEPHRGFGHLAFLTADVYKASEELEMAGVSFKKKPGTACGLSTKSGCCTVILNRTFRAAAAHRVRCIQCISLQPSFLVSLKITHTV